jgi:hypothetical protein
MTLYGESISVQVPDWLPLTSVAFSRLIVKKIKQITNPCFIVSSLDKVILVIKEKDGRRHRPLPSLFKGFRLFGNGLHRTGGDAGAAINAGVFVALGLAILSHAEGSDGTYVHAGAAANAGVFIDLNCHF